MAVKLCFFGEPLIEKDGVRLPIPFKKVEAALFYLALEGRASRETLKFLLWGDKDEAQAANNTRNAIYLLRKILPENLITDHKYVALENVERDVDAIALLADPDAPVPSFFLTEPLSGFDRLGVAEFDEWLLLTRDSIRKKIAEQMRARITSCYEQGSWDELADSLSTLLIFDPFDESSVLELMETYCRIGRAAEAVARYNAYRAKVESELGISPDGRLKDLLKKIVASTDARKSLRESVKRSVNRPEEFFCCREAEVEKILDAVSGNIDNTLLVLIHGEAGVGKSALVRHIAHSPLFADASVFTAQPLSIEGKYAYSAWDGIVSQIENGLKERGIAVKPITASILSGVFYEFMKNESAPHAVDILLNTERNPVTIGKILADLTTSLSRNSKNSQNSKNRPVFVLEDLHLFDPQSLQLLGVFLSKIKIPLTMFMTTRPESLSPVTELLYNVKSGVPRELIHIPLAPFESGGGIQIFAQSLFMEGI
ncbi:MAG: AAA family ATPase [Synergistaceae bacterium]|jgi:DNA-binding SARP family transcriptional activator|nr:AAA family ATPase [Synergistaceae bacterium]